MLFRCHVGTAHGAGIKRAIDTELVAVAVDQRDLIGSGGAEDVVEVVVPDADPCLMQLLDNLDEANQVTDGAPPVESGEITLVEQSVCEKAHSHTTRTIHGKADPTLLLVIHANQRPANITSHLAVA